MAIAVFGQVHFYPFNTDFRITFGVILFPFLLMYFYSVPIVYCTIVSAISVISLRVFLDIWTNDIIYSVAVYKHFPAFMYYISYGLIIYKLDFRKYINKPIHFLFILSFADIFSNFFELIIRNQMSSNGFESVASTLIVTAFIRSAISFSIFWVIKYYNLLIIKEEHQSKYEELLLLAAKLKSEILFLKKSMQDIEDAMQKSYSIYNAFNSKEVFDEDASKKICEDSLSLAVDIHEIKKDYHRIVTSMEKIIPNKTSNSSMTIGEIFETIQNIFEKYVEAQNLEVDLTFETKTSIKTCEYYLIISILNNLIQNSIEAIVNIDSYIRVSSFLQGEYIIFEVCDNGKGILTKDSEIIFEPGFTTKYNPNTGFVSTGLGLTHVKMLVEYLKGEIVLQYTEGVGAKFKLKIPLMSLDCHKELLI